MKKRIIEHANIFLSFPMTLTELSKRTNTKEYVLLKEFNEDLYSIDQNLAIKVEEVLIYLKENHLLLC